MTDTKSILLRLPTSVVTSLDDKRGPVSRSTFVEMMIEDSESVVVGRGPSLEDLRKELHATILAARERSSSVERLAAPTSHDGSPIPERKPMQKKGGK